MSRFDIDVNEFNVLNSSRLTLRANIDAGAVTGSMLSSSNVMLRAGDLLAGCVLVRNTLSDNPEDEDAFIEESEIPEEDLNPQDNDNYENDTTSNPAEEEGGESGEIEVTVEGEG